MTYRLPTGVEPLTIDGRPVLTTPQGGKVAVDQALLSLWQAAPGRRLDDLVAQFRSSQLPSELVWACLAVMAQAGLLARDLDAPTGGVGAPQAEAPAADEVVSAIVVGVTNSQHWIAELLPSLLAQTYPALELIVVDNAATDGLGEWLQSHFPHVKLVRLERLQTLAAAINRAVGSATGHHLLILNPDVRLAPTAVAELVAAAHRLPNCGAVAAKLKFSWAPAFINGLGNYVQDSSWGTDAGLGHLDLGQFDAWTQTQSVCFAAALIPRLAWDAVGPADEKFQLYYEDAEWSYRARLLGYPLAAAPAAVVLHAFGSQVPSGDTAALAPFKLRRAVYGRLRFALKLVGPDRLRTFLRHYAVEDLRNMGAAARQRDGATVTAYLGGWLSLIRDLPALWRERGRLQARRRRTDAELFDVPGEQPRPLAWHSLPALSVEIVRQNYLPLLRSRRTRWMPEFNDVARRPHLLIVSNDVVDKKMAGPGVRYLELARALRDALDVTLAVPMASGWEEPGLSLVQYAEDRPESLQVLVENADVALISGHMAQKFPFLESTRTRLVVDLYDPIFLENLHYHVREPMAAQLGIAQAGMNVINRLIEIGDFFICGSERQRDLWMGVLAANHRINPLTFQQDGSLRGLIDVVSTGFPDRRPRAGRLLRGVHPAVPPDARIVLWGGGIWDWLDPLTVVRAWPATLLRHPDARLVFLGTRHPNPAVPVHQMARDTEGLAEALGEKDRTILFFEWLPYADLEILLGEADVGITLHPVHVETRYSIRTRILDYLWAHVPVVVTEGDVTSEWVRELGLGEVVPPFDEQAVAAALDRVLSQPKSSWEPAFARLPEKFNWSRVAEPLRRYCLDGQYAADRQVRQGQPEPQRGSLAQVMYLWSTEGFSTMARRAWQYLQMRLAGF